MITIQAKPLTAEVKIGDYGVFTVRLMGAAAEAEIHKRFREATAYSNDVMRKYSDVLDEEKKFIADSNEAALEELRASAKFKEASKAISEAYDKLEDVKRYACSERQKLFASEDYGKLERLFTELNSEQINVIYGEIVSKLSTGSIE